MSEERLDSLVLEGELVYFISAAGQKIEMPNLTKLVEWYKTNKGNEIGERIKEILGRTIGDLLIAEVMIDMTNEKTMDRLRTGEISKTLGHVGTYNIILDSHMDQARAQFEGLLRDGKISGQFEDCLFAQFPYGMVILREKFEDYRNTQYCKKDIEELIA